MKSALEARYYQHSSQVDMDRVGESRSRGLVAAQRPNLEEPRAVLTEVG